MRSPRRRIPRDRHQTRKAPTTPQRKLTWQDKISRLITRAAKKINGEEVNYEELHKLQRELVEVTMMAIAAEFGTRDTRYLAEGFVDRCIDAMAKNREINGEQLR